MDLLESLIAHLALEELNEFRVYLKKMGKLDKEQKLFELLAFNKHVKPENIARRLYKPLNMNAYYSLRQRLLQQLYLFIVTRRFKLETQTGTGVLGMLSMGQFMLEKNAYKVASYYLLKAEQTAIRNHQFDVLESVYKVLVSNAENMGLNLSEVADRWEQNAKNYATYRKLITASAFIKSQIASAKVKGIPLDAELIISNAMDDINLSGEEANNPVFLHTIITLARSAFASTKEYRKLEPFIIQIYSELKANEAFKKGDVNFELSFMYMIAHTLYRNGKFAEAEEWVNQLSQLLSVKHFKGVAIYSKYMALKAAIYCYTGRNSEAIALLESVMEHKIKIPDVYERFNMKLNLAVYYFNESEYRKANKTLISFGKSDFWLETRLGKEWRFKKNMIETIVQYEMGNVEIAQNQLLAMQKYFGEFVKLPAYQSAGVFMKLVSKMMNDPDLVSSEAFRENVRKTNIGVADMQNDIQAVSFYSWMRSKMLKKPYYEVLLDRVNAGMDSKNGEK